MEITYITVQGCFPPKSNCSARTRLALTVREFRRRQLTLANHLVKASLMLQSYSYTSLTAFL